jgi:hypothetical protein
LWDLLGARLGTRVDGVPEAVAALLERDAAIPRDPHEHTAGSSDDPDPAALERALTRARARRREAREDRDRWRRRAEGAEARADALEAEVTELQARLESTRQELDSAQAAVAAAVSDRERAVERERRRHTTELATIREELAALRRDEEQRRTTARRRTEARAQATRDAERAVEQARREADDQRGPRVVPGRPSKLPRGVAPGTTEAARALLHRGRTVVVDGYNLTLANRGHLDLETQRTWLIQLLATLAATRKVRPIVVFDGERAGGGRPAAGLRDVEVRFTGAGYTADDEIVLAVEGTDLPVLVVTDDRELTARVTAAGADVVPTRPFVGAAS